ncbi:flagellar basal-body rod protein FlgG [Nitrincola tibetensis]|uniref:Flagellar basal-body rod protein FlgG n=1 Tax=Nitrincola tibetensis TaxID=2219697 RepID=A0A364NRX4_9GAMM|nr:flagellar basal-body rod protein FlgG [Nitrincola tibetensis]RAU19627.1 flagellar basal-body rod protein FlgG [Nitrincola tibetensis]
MHGALHVAKTGLSAQDTNLRVISNNLANVGTVGFKKDRAVFEDLLYQVRRQPGAQNANDAQLPSGLQLGHGVRTVSTQKMFETGDLQITDRSFDLAINGRGFFQVVQPNGEIAYTRNGQFHLNADNQLVTAEGYALQPAIEIPAGTVNFSVGVNGMVTTVVNGESVEQGPIELADFVNPEGLLAVGQNLFQETAASGPANVLEAGVGGVGFIKQGMLEGSNVNAVEELVNMITTQRAYEINSKVISTADQMLSFATQQL